LKKCEIQNHEEKSLQKTEVLEFIYHVLKIVKKLKNEGRPGIAELNESFSWGSIEKF